MSMNEPSRSEVSAIGHDPQAFAAFYETHLEAVQRLSRGGSLTRTWPLT